MMMMCVGIMLTMFTFLVQCVSMLTFADPMVALEETKGKLLQLSLRGS